ncbi:hypothetical protein [Hoeflea ulvae]|uniref:Uncharacterized protein n=1 Tax=Hoeflea ulvae TaxID=2983764 RepID=A0ABT3YD27_9HYPH|nr:hypothetical protein [Hoeflea ulvae]MCY0093768.1 hypothetical protein [Hoeflea ulvae]
MRTRTSIAALIALPVNAVLFGFGAIAVLSIPALAEHAKYLLPAVILAGFAATAPIAWMLAPRLRARQHRSDLPRNA